ncbi:flagellar biosynthetic protein FliP [Parvularcula bermudensis HTCC2503]|uniref:Flagellar biosynthetic protein FliP n=1 Tax=Parvularcula bermudensis (strain ATCC BAA-594 / HTCC2503 / KCTC 12087) TaxID=314260 RepID=E0TH42_PARBH|nr:flagellar type III secretion system pore protein FliP [Parvularcula bermudensis]ADM09626.1 flagellar biosynthetic protein FliP [Parvularcula bermudensis HTCC2503]
MRLVSLIIIAGALLLSPAVAQEAPSFVEGLPDMGGSLRGDIIPLLLTVTVLSLAPGILMMITCLPLMVIVFSFLRQALGIPQSPPSMMIMALALFLTFFVMEPVFQQAWEAGIAPYQEGEIDEQTAFREAIAPFRVFMEARVHDSTIAALSESLPERWDEDVMETVPLSLLVPSFMLSEIKTAFQIGFAVFLPFLAIDLVTAAVLMAMGMMMVPPAVVSLPFKLAFFVMADGWTKLSAALLRGYAG